MAHLITADEMPRIASSTAFGCVWWPGAQLHARHEHTRRHKQESKMITRRLVQKGRWDKGFSRKACFEWASSPFGNTNLFGELGRGRPSSIVTRSRVTKRLSSFRAKWPLVVERPLCHEKKGQEAWRSRDTPNISLENNHDLPRDPGFAAGCERPSAHERPEHN